MTEFLAYVIKVSLCLTLFYCLYLVAFKNTTFFMANRLYLATCLVLAWIIPLVDLTFVDIDTHAFSAQISAIQINSNLELPDSKILKVADPVFTYAIFVAIYWFGVFFFASRLFYSCYSIFCLKRSAIQSSQNKKVFYADIVEPFSFLHWIFLPITSTSPLILEHEKVHIRQHHWIDLLLVELVAILLWFNPIMILYRRSVTIQHEYAADASVSTNAASVETYLSCMVTHLQTKVYLGPLSHFYSKQIKQRILMITKKKTPSLFSVVYTLTAPVAIVLLLSFSNSVYDYGLVVPGEEGKVIIVDAGHGGDDSGSSHESRIAEKEIVLSLARAIQETGEAQNITVVLTRSNDVGISLADRVALSRKHKADLFISLHANADVQNPLATGIHCLVSSGNARFEDSKRMAESLLQGLSDLEGMPVNGVKESSAYVLANNSVPAVILEMGYLSNAKDYAYVTDPVNLRNVAQRIITAVVK